MPVNVGVTHASIIGPLMFIIFMSSSIKCSAVLKFVMYADGITIFISSETLYEAFQPINTEKPHV